MRVRRLTIPDARGQGASLRVTRHPEQRKVVLSHWRDGVCVASTPVELGEIPVLIGVLADALGDGVRSDDLSPAVTKPHLLAMVKAWLRPRLAQVVELRAPKDSAGQERHTG